MTLSMRYPAIDETHDPALSSWVEGADDHPDFPVQNLPLGIVSTGGGDPRVGVAIGEHVLDLAAIAGLLPDDGRAALSQPSLNAYMALRPEQRLALRRRLSSLLTREDERRAIEPHLHRASACMLHMPARIGDYTDFYTGIHHAVNLGSVFRPDHPLLPNYKHVPIGYHGRASSVRISGVPVRRPSGQVRTAEGTAPELAPTRRLDFELELGFWVGAANRPGEALPIERAPDSLVGICLLNDWSARDVQAWEYQPLGPFLAKNFHTTISPWVVTAEALAPFRIAQPARPEGDPAPLPYLFDAADQAHGALSLDLHVALLPRGGTEAVPIARSHASHMYWTPAQLVAHHSVGGCNLEPGDLLGSGTISAPVPSGLGSLMEMTRGWKDPITLPDGQSRLALEDGDEIRLSAVASAPGFRSIGLGRCDGRVVA
ncbi:fumarylacetoacetase [Rhizorhabdus wittichii RW1]|uniref:fumarylacetoacetase n=1 Tax=Rhizorhabdus wittichii (strain DSM 6014 / CCUG 31198 / JCM 15750 / NBRC 105917 / EY 4224 / RW1) TaxID=392499 RepID=A0A9J9HAJ8_RHIWR|nr:fumarylacetoacetase [Rhizorhabdus wittichii RW1]